MSSYLARCLAILGLCSLGLLQAQKSVTLSGYVRDKATGEDLFGAVISLYQEGESPKSAASNSYGFYSLSVQPGEYRLEISSLGYPSQERPISLLRDSSLNFNLDDSEGGVEIDQIVVSERKGDENIRSTQMGTLEIPVELAKKLPALMGEVDILKTLQLMPGVLSAGEGNAGFFVRGGSVDQNLILLDEAVVYNPGHLLGFFSVFNADAIKGATLIKGGMPAYYGGRISSVLDVQMKEGNSEDYVLEGGLGIISSRLTFQGPIVRGKSSFIVSGRRTYAFDLAQPLIRNTRFAGTNYYFYDLNVKANYRISQKDRIFLSGYFGRDVLELKSSDRNIGLSMPWGNATATLRWNHLINDKMFVNTMLIFNDYDFAIRGGQTDFSFSLMSGVRDYGTKLSFDYYPNTNHAIKFGGEHTYHIFRPSVAEAFNGDEAFLINPEKRYTHESAIFIQDDLKIGTRFGMNFGLRGSTFAQVGPYTSKLDSGRVYRTGEQVRRYWGLEPRWSARYNLDEASSLKAGVTLGRQYIHLVSNSATTLPTDLWVPSTELVAPQWGLQYALGYFRNFDNNAWETSVEVYYKDLYNQLDYSEDFTQTPDTQVEDQFISGRGYCYGAEFLIRRNKGPLTGWLSYTYSRALRRFDDIKGEIFPARFDRPHNLSLVLSYALNERLDFGATFVYGSGQPYTPIESIYLLNFEPTIEYGLRNSARLPAYHRLDLSVSWQLHDPKKKKPFESNLVFSVYNAYNRLNVFFTYIAPESDALSGRIELNSYQVSLFPIIPSITWNFKWKLPRKSLVGLE